MIWIAVFCSEAELLEAAAGNDDTATEDETIALEEDDTAALDDAADDNARLLLVTVFLLEEAVAVAELEPPVSFPAQAVKNTKLAAKDTKDNFVNVDIRLHRNG
jgi:hypothetical protein